MVYYLCVSYNRISNISCILDTYHYTLYCEISNKDLHGVELLINKYEELKKIIKKILHHPVLRVEFVYKQINDEITYIYEKEKDPLDCLPNIGEIKHDINQITGLDKKIHDMLI